MAFWTFIKEALSDDGKADVGKICSVLITISVLTWVFLFLLKHWALPDLTGPATFMGIGTASHYGINKVNDIVAAYKNPAPPSPTP